MSKPLIYSTNNGALVIAQSAEQNGEAKKVQIEPDYLLTFLREMNVLGLAALLNNSTVGFQPPQQPITTPEATI